jgi:hypothetical protein
MNLQTPLTAEQLDALLHRTEHSSSDLELTSLRAVFTDLRTSSLAAASHHRRHASITPVRTHGVLWGALATAAVLLCAATPLAIHRHPTRIQPVAVTPQPHIAPISDDTLFADVQADVNASVPSPLLPLTNDTSTNSTTQKDTQ